MGAIEFNDKITAKTAQEAFKLLVAKAKQERREMAEHDDEEFCEDGTYAGTIEAKSDFDMELPEPGESVSACIDRCMSDDEGHWAMESSSPAACVDGGADPQRPGYHTYHFFGLARR